MAKLIPIKDRVAVVRVKTELQTESGIVLDGVRSGQVDKAKVIAIGPLAFCNRETQQPWPEGAWAQVGEYVRVPKWGGDRWEVDFEDAKGAKGKALFTFFNDHELIGKVTGDPRAIKAFI
jgi:co-chaperonin GroES (HSP10)